LLGKVDSFLIIPNDRLKYATDQKVTFANAFEIADDVLRQAVTSISDLIKNTGFINLDFADVTTIMKGAGFAHMGVGKAREKERPRTAAKAAIASPLMETSIDGARGVLINITAPWIWAWRTWRPPPIWCRPPRTRTPISSSAPRLNDSLDDEIRVTVIATGFDEKPDAKAQKDEQPATESKLYTGAAKMAGNAQKQQPAPYPPRPRKSRRKRTRSTAFSRSSTPTNKAGKRKYRKVKPCPGSHRAGFYQIAVQKGRSSCAPE
jgi:cell division protein FtsZ